MITLGNSHIKNRYKSTKITWRFSLLPGGISLLMPIISQLSIEDYCTITASR